MKAPSPHILCPTAVLTIAILLLGGCSTVSKIKGPEDGASSEAAARSMAPQDPLARPTQIGWTSARATRCGFIFNPDQLRANYLQAEAARGLNTLQMQKIEKAYDYTRESVLSTIKDDPGYCNKERTDAIRIDLNRYLAGDYSPQARMAR